MMLPLQDDAMEFLPLLFVFLIFIISQIKSSDEKNKADFQIPDNALVRACKSLECKINKTGDYASGKSHNISYSIRLNINTNSFEIFINHSLPVTGRINIKKESLISIIKKDFGKNDLILGDKKFDDQMLIKATYPYAMHALLQSQNRKIILNMNDLCDNFELSNSWLKIHLPINANSEMIRRALNTGISVSNSLMRETDLKKMLIHNIFHDPLEEVRLNNLKALITHYPKAREINQVLEDALQDTHITVQIEAAEHLKENGMRHLSALLQNSLSDKRLIQIIKILSKNKYQEAGPQLEILYAKKNQDIQIEILKAFKSFQNNSLEPFLLDRLQDRNINIAHHAIDALATCGTVNAMDTLYKLYTNAPDSKTGKKSYDAMAAIQARLGIDKGWLSVSDLDGPEGGLSITDHRKEGALSPVNDEEKQ